MLNWSGFVLRFRHSMLIAGFLDWYRIIRRRLAPHHVRRDAGRRPNDEQADGCQFPLIHVSHDFPPDFVGSALIPVFPCIVTPMLTMLTRYLIGPIKTVFSVAPLV